MKHRFNFLIMSCLLVLFGTSSTTTKTESHHVRHASSTEADLLVRVRGVGVCSGSPIVGTNYVVTAAHCVLDPMTGTIGSRYDLRVERDSQRYDIVEVLVDTTPRDGVDAANDAAVLVMETSVPGPGIHLPSSASFSSATLVGFQSLDSDGTWLRGNNYDDLDRIKGASAGIVYISSAPAACTVPTAMIESRKGFSWIPCGMIPGGSGGPFVKDSASGYQLVGVLSTVSYNLTHNGITPAAKVIELLENQDTYRREIPQAEYNAATMQHR